MEDIMKFFFNSILICLMFFTSCKEQQIAKEITKPIKIACIGNSITYGAGVANREKNAYPTQLQELLGSQYTVRNFGVSGRTLLKKGDHPYWETEAYKKALLFKPDVVYIKLGTNDSKQQNRVYLDEFETDYEELIASFKEQNNNVKIVVLLPIPSFLNDSTSIWNPVIKNKVIPKLQEIAYKNKLEILDLYQLFIDKSDLLPDKIHPSSLGATVIAKRLYEHVMLKESKALDFINNRAITASQKENFYGYQLTNFKFKEWHCKIVKPKKVATGNPWVIRARFWGHEPQTDIALLERGFHIAYCDVANLFGSLEGVKRWNDFYGLMTTTGFSKKVALEGMSRGGLIIYNWAVENPEKVACIYADAPVLDGTSWPGGFGKGKGSLSDWERFKDVYNLNSKKDISEFSDNPIHKTDKIANVGFPMMHVCGEVDKVVPVDENTRLFEEKIKQLGGDIITIYKKDIDHHPHSLKNPTPIVNFILRATGHKINFATKIAPGSEYRSGAGWKQGKGWWFQMQDIDSMCINSGKVNLLLIGNSITQGFGGNRPNITYAPGEHAAKTYFKNLKIIGAGISGDRTQHVAWRLKNGHYQVCKPNFVTLTIGVNNFEDNTAEEIAEGIVLNVKLIEEKFPDSKILLFGPLPTGIKKDSDRRKKYTKVHKLISYLGNKKSIHYHNMITVFSDNSGNLDENYYQGDGIHLKSEGYNIWAKYIKNQIKK